MPVRDLSDGGVVRFLPGLSDQADDFTVAALVKPYSAFGVTHWIWSRDNASFAGPGGWTSLGIESGGLHFYPSGGGTAAFFDEWLLLVCTKPAGAEGARYYIYRFTAEEWVSHEDGGWSAIHSGAPERVQLGRWGGGEQFHGLYAACAIFPTSFNLAEAEALLALPTIADWLTEEPLALWMLNQASVEEEVIDATGNGADEVTREGTEVVEEEPPIPFGEGEEPEPGNVKAKPITLTAGVPVPTIEAVSAATEIEAPSPLLTAGVGAGIEVATGPVPSATESHKGLPLPFPSILANPGRLGPPRFNNRERKTLRLED